MKVELELSIEEEDESAVMDKISELTRLAKAQGFKVDEIEIERDEDEEEESEDEEDEEESEEKEEGMKGAKKKTKRSKKQKRS
jgi:hypothetical protein